MDLTSTCEAKLSMTISILCVGAQAQDDPGRVAGCRSKSSGSKSGALNAPPRKTDLRRFKQRLPDQFLHFFFFLF